MTGQTIRPGVAARAARNRVLHNRLEGIDYLRAVMSIFVVIWHMGGGGRSRIFSIDTYLEHAFTLSDLVNFHLLLLAVPVFILIANFLYACQPVNRHTLRKRLQRILVLLTFWPLVFILSRQGIDGLMRLVPDNASALIVVILGAGNTIYYFFVGLLISNLITHFLMRLKSPSLLIGTIVSIVVLASLPWITLRSGFYPLSAYWSPLNVIPFSFTAVLVAQNRNLVQAYKLSLISLCIVLAILMSAMEWHYAVGEVFFAGQGFGIPAYTRTSLLFSAIAITIIAIDNNIKSHAVIRFMARYSLALYCIHPFLIDPIQSFVSTFTQDAILWSAGSIILVILSSYGLGIILRLYLNKNVIA